MRNCTHFRHPTDEQLQHRYIFLVTTIICNLSTLLNVVITVLLEFSKINVLFEHSGIIVSETDLSGNSRNLSGMHNLRQNNMQRTPSPLHHI